MTDSAEMVASALEIGYRTSAGPVARVDFTIPGSRVVAVVGPNGAGKSTLLKTLVGLLPPLAGSVAINGLPNDEYRHRFGIGYLPEELTLPGAWSGRGLMALSALAGERPTAAELSDALALASVDFDLDQRVDRMSKGMRRRLALAMTLAPPPNVLLLDEPEAGLDPAQRIRLRDRIRAFARTGRIVLIASHDVTGICTIADETYILREKSLQSVSQAALSDPALILQLFDGGGAH